MPFRVVINGKPVSEPAVKIAVALAALGLVAALLALLFVIMLPLVGMALALAVGVMVSGLLTAGASVPLLRGRRQAKHRLGRGEPVRVEPLAPPRDSAP